MNVTDEEKINYFRNTLSKYIKWSEQQRELIVEIKKYIEDYLGNIEAKEVNGFVICRDIEDMILSWKKKYGHKNIG